MTELSKQVSHMSRRRTSVLKILSSAGKNVCLFDELDLGLLVLNFIRWLLSPSWSAL